MPEISFDKELNLPGNTSTFVKLKSKGDKIKFRIAKKPHYETIHWIGDRKFTLCGRYNSDDRDAECSWCDDYDKAVDAGDKKTADAIKAQTNFYYPVLLLESNASEKVGKPAIFSFSAKSIHYTIKGYAKEEVDVFACDWMVERTEEQGNYYSVKRLSDKPLSKELQEQFELAKQLKLKAKESKSVVVDNNSDLPEELK